MKDFIVVIESKLTFWPTVNDRLNALGVYLKSKCYPGRLFGRGVYLQDQLFAQV